MFNFDTSVISDSSKIHESIYNSYYPNGEQLIKNTSYYSPEFGNGFSKERTLTTRTLSDALTGDILFRNSKFATTFYNKNVSSSLNSLITGGSDAVHTTNDVYVIPNPDDPSGTTTLKGNAALNRVFLDSIAGKSGASEFINHASSSIEQITNTTISGNPNPINGGTTVADGSGTGGGSSADTNLFGIDGGGVSLASKLSPEEKKWILERGQQVLNTGSIYDYSVLKTGFQFDIDNSYSGQKIYSTGNFFPGNVNTYATVPNDIIAMPSQTAYICPAILELCIFLSSKIYFKGGFGVTRNQVTTYNNFLTVADHGFGRAIDIDIVGPINGKNIDLKSANVDDWAAAFELVIKAMQTLPNYLIPDLIIFHDAVGYKLDITRNDMQKGIFRKKYPFLKYTDLTPRADHRNHIHISYSQGRNGKYSGPNGEMGTGQPAGYNPSGGLTMNPGFVDLTTISISNNPKFKNKYLNDQDALTKEEVFQLLRGTVMKDEDAAVFAEISHRESRSKPGVCTINSNTLDISFGLFGMNFSVGAHGLKNYAVILPSAKTETGWKLAYKNWNSDNVTKSNFDSVMYSHENDPDKGRSLFDESVWIPINQAYMLYTAIAGKPFSGQKLPNLAESSGHFGGWGDYGGGPTYGWITGLDFNEIAKLYVGAGHTKDELKTWILKMFKNAGSKFGNKPARSAQYAENWVNGYYYKRSGEIIAP